MMRTTLSFVILSAALFSAPLPVWAKSYTVVQGDTLYKIARQYQTTADELIRYNQLPSAQLSIGQVLTIPVTANRISEENPEVAVAQPAGEFRGASVSPSASAAVSKVFVTVPTLNVRTFPSVDSLIIGKVNYGTQLAVVSSGPEWMNITYNGSPAYVAAAYVSSSPDQGMPLPGQNRLSPVGADADAKGLMSLVQPLLGAPYRLGGTTPDGFDCSGFTSYVMQQLGARLPRTAEEQFASGQEVTYAEAVPSDLLFYDALNKGKVSHVAIYLGNGKIVHANGDTVRFEKVENMNRLYPFYGVKRYLAVKSQ